VSDVAEGDVVRQLLGAGTKSERDAVVLRTADGTVALRRRGGNAFADPELDALVGRRVRVQGTATPTTFLADDIEVLEPGDASGPSSPGD
jgi:hypothetical protein